MILFKYVKLYQGISHLHAKNGMISVWNLTMQHWKDILDIPQFRDPTDKEFSHVICLINVFEWINELI